MTTTAWLIYAIFAIILILLAISALILTLNPRRPHNERRRDDHNDVDSLAERDRRR